MADSIFTKIVRGEIPCHKIHEDAHVIAFLDIRPLAFGHALVVPKQQVQRLEDLPADDAVAVMRVLPGIAKRVIAAVGATDYNVLLNNGPQAGQEVPHVHFHIIPRQPDDGLGYRWNAKEADEAALTALAAKLKG